jgi:hypothetical protein
MMVICPFGPKTIVSDIVGVGDVGITMVVGSGLVDPGLTGFVGLDGVVRWWYCAKDEVAVMRVMMAAADNEVTSDCFIGPPVGLGLCEDCIVECGRSQGVYGVMGEFIGSGFVVVEDGE